jgi:hypothetical protein
VNTLQMAVLLVMNFTSAVQTPTQMAQALYAAGYDSVSAMSSLAQIYPLNSTADFIAAIRNTYPATAQDMAKRLHTAQVIAPDAAPRIKQIFPNYNGDPAGMVTLLQNYFPESAATPTQLAWALGASGYSSQEATNALKGISQNLAVIIGAIKAAYPSPSIQQQIQPLLSQDASAAIAAAQIHAANQDVNAAQMAVLLMMNFRKTVQTPEQMAQALKNAAYIKADAGNALSQVFPLSAASDLSNLIDQVYR